MPIETVLALLTGCSPPADTSKRPACGDEIPYDSVDQDCDGVDLTDVDADGSPADLDCDDADAGVHPEADDIPYDGIDQDCDGEDRDDLDDDGFSLAQDCDDTEGDIHPEAEEVCDGVDQDCDGDVDEDPTDGDVWYVDSDADGFGDPDSAFLSCSRDGVADASDCDDDDAAVFPGAEEVCGNETDDNCDGYTDEMVAGITHATVQGAVDAACDAGDTVWVAAGTYVENLYLVIPVVLESIDGADVTTLDGSSCARGAEACHTILAVGSPVEIRGFHITGGNASRDSSGAQDGYNGGGIYATLVRKFVVSDCLVEGNVAAGEGGGIHVDGDGEIVDNEIRDNTAGQGGGVYVERLPGEDFSLTVLNNVIIGNLAVFDGGGGAEDSDGWDDLCLWSGNTISNNTADRGAGLSADNAIRTESNTITANTAVEEGGGVWFHYFWESTGDVVSGNSPDDVWDEGTHTSY